MYFGTLFLLIFCTAAFADEADRFFDDSQVQEVRITFENPDWYAVLFESHAHDPEDPYFLASFTYEEITMDSVGVRFKGNSSFGIPTVKKSFKIDFDEFDEDNDALRFLGLKKLCLNNSFNDPTMLREKLFLDFARSYGPSMRAVHTRVYINDEYWGLYTGIEQVDKTYVQRHFGDSEDGNLFKCEGTNGSFGSDMTWLGTDPLPYENFYQLKTNEAVNDYSQLVECIDVLNNAPAEQLPDLLEPIFDVYGALRCLAMNCLFVNLDSYNGSAHNYYLYDRDADERITHLLWDTNASFGRFIWGVPPWEDPLEILPFWLPDLPPQQPVAERPLMENLWAVPEWEAYYLNFLALMLQEGFNVGDMEARINELADLIRADVYADPHTMYPNNAFEINLRNNIPDGNRIIYGLRFFTGVRHNFLMGVLPTLDAVEPLFINEIMADNGSTIADENGDFDDWVEIHNAAGYAVDLAGYWVTDGNEDLWQIPDGDPGTTTIPAGGYLLLWFDKDSEDGPLHVEAKLSSSGEGVYLYAPDRLQLVDSCIFAEQREDVSYGRYADDEETWYLMGNPTPGSSNMPPVNLPPVIDELVQTPLYPTVADEVFLSVEVLDESQVTSVQLFWDMGSGWQNTAFASDGNDGWFAQIPAHASETVVQYYIAAEDDSAAVTLDPPDGAADPYSYTILADPCATPLIINEFMASNDATLADEFGEYDDWVELYNPTDCDVNLDGIYLTDDLADPTKFQLSLGTDSLLASDSYVIVWLDNDPEQGPFHADFKLSAGGEQLGVTFADGSTWADSLTYGEQTADISYGRLPNGTETWAFFESPTPGASNGVTELPAITDLSIVNNGGTVSISWSAIAGASIYHIYRSEMPYDGWVHLEDTADASWSGALATTSGFYRVTVE